ncbi:hypothetical protein APHAL10511_007698 [Amanita phalloides]|nr:hypothetical protein APHAL10511_007698 [Amanita phalloides]
MLPYLSPSLSRATAVGRTCVMSSTRRLRPSAIRHLATSTMSGNDPQILEVEKHRNLSKSQHHTSTPLSNAPGWNEALATESEAFVKADKSLEKNGDMQAKTIEYLRARHSSDDRVGSTVADYAREEVMGPLSGAQGREDTNTDADDVDVDTIQSQRQRSKVEAFSAGGDTVVQETVEEETVHKTIRAENPTLSEEAVRADAGKPIFT